jgi:general secretion pathway protein F
MPVFEYKALDAKGKVNNGVVDADTPKEAREKLRKKQIFVTSMTDSDTGKKKSRKKVAAKTANIGSSLERINAMFQNPRRSEITALTRQLATLLSAGIPLVDSLNALVQQVESKEVEKALRTIREDVQSGITFADSLARHPIYFSELYTNMVRAGEASGALDDILKRLAAFMYAQNKMKNRVMAALTYPIIMCVAGTGVVIFLLTYVVPKITKVITKRGGPLPAPTALLIVIQNIFVNYWWIIAIICGSLFVLYQAVVATDKGALWRDTWKLKIPVFGELFRKQSVSRFATTFSTLLGSGIQATECLRILQNVVDNKLISNVLANVRERIIEGTDIATPLKKSGVFPPVVGYMIAVGEQSGQLEDILEKISESYDEEVEITTSKVTSLIEPIIIIVMAFIVGFIVLAVVLPLVSGFKM